MEKKQYTEPLVQWEVWSMQNVMKTTDGGSPVLPPGPGNAPARRTDVF